MTRFEREMSGELGEFWRNRALKELDDLQEELRNGEITIDRDGVARNCIGRVVVEDVLEKLTHITDKVDAEKTDAARDEETRAFFREYRRNARPATEEELMEMRAAFGAGQTVVDVITGQTYHL